MTMCVNLVKPKNATKLNAEFGGLTEDTRIFDRSTKLKH